MTHDDILDCILDRRGGVLLRDSSSKDMGVRLVLAKFFVYKNHLSDQRIYVKEELKQSLQSCILFFKRVKAVNLPSLKFEIPRVPVVIKRSHEFKV